MKRLFALGLALLLMGNFTLIRRIRCKDPQRTYEELSRLSRIQQEDLWQNLRQ